MSRVGIVPIALPDGVTASVRDGVVTVKGAKGEARQGVPSFISVKVEDGAVKVGRSAEHKQARAMHGTIRSLVANMIEGVSKGFEKELQIEGVGYRAQLQDQVLVLSVGLSHPVRFPVPEGITITVPNPTTVTISGVSKHQVGLVSARLRSYAPAEPYKGKGVRYKGEKIRRKVGKAVA